MNKVYTKAGDKGFTRIIGGEKISKGHIKIESYGCVDELICLVGIARSYLPEFSSKSNNFDVSDLESLLKQIQNELFDLGSMLATPAGHDFDDKPHVNQSHVEFLEKQIDTYQEELTPLKSFVLPGGNMLNAYLHHCRTFCRSVERQIIRLGEMEEIKPGIVKYINRLSDLFFVLARYVSVKIGTEEYLWESGLKY
ncbi:MAG: cob(I)yrinic acid a,c-diamide adenosyltransferase [bacterium]|nr:cob(I)yrinic acid a,c-diamide adenosyltransferase [bacterium]